MSRDADDDGCEPMILSDENLLSVWAGEGGYVPPVSDEAAGESDTRGW